MYVQFIELRMIVHSSVIYTHSYFLLRLLERNTDSLEKILIQSFFFF